MRDAMNIYAKEWDKVVFHGEGGYPKERENARSVLTVDQTYTVNKVSVGNFSSDVELKEFLGMWWNTVLFWSGK